MNLKTALGIILSVAATQACAADLSGIPQNCHAPLAHDMELSNIPYLLDLDRAAHITKIDTVGGTEAYQYALNLYRIDCFINVHWSNGTVDMSYRFSMWEDRYGEINGSYTQH